jgi:lipopolysaccharide export LptBFGC system permease protein LptF
VGVFAFLVYYGLVKVGDGLGEARLIGPWLAAWFPNLLLVVVTLWPFQRGVLSR